MRWRFVESEEERARRAEVVARIDAFWAAFAREQAALRDDGEACVEFMQSHLPHIDERLMWEAQPPSWNAAYVATQCLLGEERTRRWIGKVQLAPAQFRPALLMRKRPTPEAERAIDLGALPAVVSQAIEDHLQGLPEWPRSFGQPVPDDGEDSERVIGHTYRIGPPEFADDYPGRSDVWSGSTCAFDIVTATVGPYFHSTKYSRCGETFVYVKFERADPEDTDLTPRNEIDEAIDDALEAANLGASLGGAIGHRYFYVSVSLLDLDRGIEVVRETLRRQEVPERSWILFYDYELAHEWVGVYPNTPPPPR